MDKLKKLIFSKLFFPLVFLISWSPAIYLHYQTDRLEGLIVFLYLIPFLVYIGLLVRSLIK